ncbi:sensor histidine kinase [Hyalangium rubrum]|uniref:histidine kinase n=1 Tax=Hyalangium rubrum TaxID=3103134 RepID=A0ABU5H1N3_9BACT|nr:PAS domain S-box protein [Hyalangium sp. s54d21]MDY7227017.1 PAS domain S-box protein [Hyalangium sp. s54d21]
MSAPPLPSAPPATLSEELFSSQHHALIRAILDNISEGVSVADPQGRFIYVSAFARRLYNSTAPYAEPEQWSQQYGIFRPDEQTPYPSEEMPIWTALKGIPARDVDMFIRNPSIPQGLHVRTTSLPMRDEQGQLLGALVLTQNIDSQRRAEADKRRTERHFQLLVETAQEGIWTIDPSWRTTYINRYMAELLGYRVEEVVGQHLFNFLGPEARKNAEENLRRAGDAPRARVRDFPFLRRDGVTVWTRMSTTPTFDEHGQYSGSLAMITDITERRAAEEQVRQLNEQLERRITERTTELEFSNRELEAFAYSVAHDLRAPLRSIASFSQALEEDCKERLDDTGRDYLRRIVGGARRMAELIDGILALSRVNRTALANRECDLTAMAHSILEQLKTLNPEREVRIRVEERMVERGDPSLLRNVLENLLGNAWKFTRERPVAEIDFGFTQEPGGVRTYFVRDNGAGFNMAYHEKLFGVFQRLHTQREFEGTGVGLATVQRIIRRHGGRIWGEGQPGHGACFFFTLNEFPLPQGTAARTSGT